MGRKCGTYGERRGAYRALVGKPDGRRPLGRPRLRWGILLKWIFERLDGGNRLDRSASGFGLVVGCCEYGDEPSFSIKYGKSLE
jgi:hypothetical protein